MAFFLDRWRVADLKRNDDRPVLQPTATPILRHISDEVDAGSPQKMPQQKIWTAHA
jgi:hypothetical protein